MAGETKSKSPLGAWQVVNASGDERPLEEIAAELGPFSPPPNYQLEPEFAAQPPRPITATLRAGPYARRWRRNMVTILCFGLVCLASARVGIVQELGNYILPLAYLQWVAYGLFALAAIGVIKHLATGDRLRYVREGVPIVVRILAMKHEVQRGETPQFRFLAGVDCQDPETGRVTFAWLRSEPFSSPLADSSRFQPPYQVGEYVTAVYLPGKFEKTACVYSLLGLNPDIGGVLKDGRPWWPGLSPFAAMCLVVGIVGVFVLLVAGMYAIEFCTPIDFSGRDFLKWGVPAGLVVGMLGGFGMIWLSRHEQRKGKSSKKPRPLLAWVCGMLLGFVAGVVMMMIANAALDSSPAQYREVEIVNTWETTHHGIIRSYEIEYAELGSGKKAKYPARPEHINEFKMGAGVLDIRKGFLGMPWARQIYPVDLREVSNPRDYPEVLAIPQRKAKPGQEELAYYALVVVLEKGKTLPASEAIWDLVRRQNAEMSGMPPGPRPDMEEDTEPDPEPPAGSGPANNIDERRL